MLCWRHCSNSRRTAFVASQRKKGIVASWRKAESMSKECQRGCDIVGSLDMATSASQGCGFGHIRAVVSLLSVVC